ncbi:hypothetical protein AAZX31_10G165200 [Glycine max]
MPVVIEIKEGEPEECGRACVCRVPKSLCSAKPEAFTPQFVGLGPYHSFDDKLTMTLELKLAAAKRVFKHAFEIPISKSIYEHLYHADAFQKPESSYALAQDGLFLLALLHWSADAEPQQHYSFLTGRQGLPLVNSFGLELTIDAVISDVYMLENQIPTPVLHQVNQASFCKGKSESDEIQPQEDLGAKMQSLCEKHCPLVHLQQLSKKPQEYDHLLDLMYHFIVPDEKPKIDSGNSQLTISQSNQDSVLIYHLLGFISPLFESNPQSSTDEEEGFFLLFICLIIFFVWELIRHIPALFMRALRSIYDLLKYVSRLIQPTVDSLYGSLSTRQSQNQLLKSVTLLVGGVKRASEEILRDKNLDKDVRSVATIPSVTELHKAGIGFQPAKLGGISGIEYDEGTCMFSLPSIKLNVNSEVIMRNLMAYESLIDSKRPLVFSRYVEIMRAIIGTREDVKLLVQREIIQTELSDQVVADLFNGISKSIRPTNTQDLEKVIKKVNAKYDDSQKVNRAMVKYVYSAEKFYTFVAAFVFLVLTAVQAYCSVYSCHRSSRYTKMPSDGDYNYNRDHYFLSSL